MKSLKVISCLMDYPNAEVQKHIDELCAVVTSSNELSYALKDRLLELIDSIYGGDLLDAQETYTHVFDYGRAMSLLLFEHVHGESRDRGQAMVDLMALYEGNEFAINVRELPDYIPLYLEYLSHRPAAEAKDGLADIAHILGLLCARLKERKSDYAVLFESLLMISGETVEMEKLLELAAKEEPDNTPEALDKIWEEEQVTFGAGDAHDSCDVKPGFSSGSSSSSPSSSSSSAPPQSEPHVQNTPLHWVQNS